MAVSSSTTPPPARDGCGRTRVFELLATGRLARGEWFGRETVTIAGPPPRTGGAGSSPGPHVGHRRSPPGTRLPALHGSLTAQELQERRDRRLSRHAGRRARRGPRRAILRRQVSRGAGQGEPEDGAPQLTADEWAETQIYENTVTRIENLAGKATATRGPWIHGANPSGDRGIRRLTFRVRSTSPEVVSAIGRQLARLTARVPGWIFDAIHGVQ